VVEKETHFEGGSGKAGTQPEDIHGKWEGKQYGKNILLGPVTLSQTTGWQPQCECYGVELPKYPTKDVFTNPEPTPEYIKLCDEIHTERLRLLKEWEKLEAVPQKVLDPFNGSGTAGEVSIKHKRNYIGCELNPEYIELTHKRLAEVEVRLF